YGGAPRSLARRRRRGWSSSRDILGTRRPRELIGSTPGPKGATGGLPRRRVVRRWRRRRPRGRVVRLAMPLVEDAVRASLPRSGRAAAPVRRGAPRRARSLVLVTAAVAPARARPVAVAATPAAPAPEDQSEQAEEQEQ